MSSNEKIGIEIERKYVIKMPEVAILQAQPSYRRYEILQTYISSLPGVTRRVRSLSFGNITKYIETVKVRIDHMSSTEVEQELTESEYLERLALKLPDTTPIKKTRHTLLYEGQLFEIDVYPQWTSTAIMETELKDRDVQVKFPDFLHILAEVTGDKSYSNASMSRSFPTELK